jgi:hypothetical protein
MAAQIIHMDKGIVPRSGIDTKMQDGVIIIRRVGYLDINYIYDIKSALLHDYFKSFFVNVLVLLTEWK